MTNPAQTARQRKQAKPWLFCPRCLWMTGDGRACPRHGGPEWTDEWEALARRISREELTVKQARAFSMLRSTVDGNHDTRMPALQRMTDEELARGVENFTEDADL